MLKIHSFLQRIKRFLCRILPNGRENYKIYMAVIAYSLITVLILMTPNYIYGLESDHALTMSLKPVNDDNSSEIEETANAAIIQVTQPNPELQFILYNYTQTMSVSNKNITNLLSTNNITKQDSISANENKIANSINLSTRSVIPNTEQEVEVDIIEEAKVNATTDTLTMEKETEKTTTNANSNTDRADAKTVKKEDNTQSKETLASVKYVVDLSKNEVEILQRIVEAEATGEDLTGKMLVANVILNRVKDEDFPDTVEDVVFQQDGSTYQFSPIKDKRYWSVKVSEDTITAVDRVLLGEDSSQGALYFSARSRADKTSMSWFDKNLKFLYEHGGHEFFKNK